MYSESIKQPSIQICNNGKFKDVLDCFIDGFKSGGMSRKVVKVNNDIYSDVIYLCHALCCCHFTVSLAHQQRNVIPRGNKNVMKWPNVPLVPLKASSKNKYDLEAHFGHMLTCIFYISSKVYIVKLSLPLGNISYLTVSIWAQSHDEANNPYFQLFGYLTLRPW